MSCNIKNIKTCEIFGDTIFPRNFRFNTLPQKVTASIQRTDSPTIQEVDLTLSSQVFSLDIQSLNLVVGNYRITYVLEVLVEAELIERTFCVENISILKNGCNCEDSQGAEFDFLVDATMLMIDVNISIAQLNIGEGSGGNLTPSQVKVLYEQNANTNAFTDNEKTKLSGLTNFDSSAIVEMIEEKVDKVDGFGLSQENFTPEEKAKLAGIESNKFKGKFSSLPALNLVIGESGSYAYVGGIGQNDVSYIWDDDDNIWVLNSSQATAETPSSIKSKYESNPDTNAFTDELKLKLNSLFNYNDTLLWSSVNNKVDKIAGRGLSEQNFTIDEKNNVALIPNKVDKDGVKVLSEQNFTLALKTKLDGIETGANNFTLLVASGTTLGGVKEVFLTQSQYDALTPKLADVKYHIEKV